jgi:hypothetical protein
VLWVIRDCLSGIIVLARSLLSGRALDLAALLQEVVDAVGEPVVGVISDGQTFIRQAVALVLGAHQRIDLSMSTLADQVGACTLALQPLHARIEAHVLAAERLHGNETKVLILAKGPTVTGQILPECLLHLRS